MYEDIKKRWQEYTEELFKKDLHDPDDHEDVITHTHLDLDILECSQVGFRKHHYKASGGDGIPVELFQILKDDAEEVLHSVCQQIWKTQQWPQDWKRSVFILLPEFTQTHVHRVSDAIQPSHPLSSPSPPAPNPSQQQSLFQ